MKVLVIRQETLEDLEEKSLGLVDASQTFKNSGTKLRKHMWMQVRGRESRGARAGSPVTSIGGPMGVSERILGSEHIQVWCKES